MNKTNEISNDAPVTVSSYKVENATSGLNNLVDLISVICQLQFEGDNDKRVGSLLWIARDLSEGTLECDLETRRIQREGAKC